MRRRVAVEVVDGSIFVLRGWQAHRLAVEAGLRPTYNGVRQGWVADTTKLPTFEAYCAHRYVSVDITGVEITLSVRTADQVVDSDSVADSPLFELDGGR
jgi:hypothetical protein